MDDQKYPGMLVAGSPNTVLGRGVLVGLAPDPYVRPDESVPPEMTTGWGVEFSGTSLLGGSHTLGVGFGGLNLGVTMHSEPGQTIRVYAAWLDLDLTKFLQGEPLPCAGRGFLTIDNPGMSYLSRIIVSQGGNLSILAETFVSLSVNHAPLDGPPDITFEFNKCPRELAFRTDDLAGVNGAVLKFGNFTGSLWEVPNGLHFRRVAEIDWADGYELRASGPLSGTLEGKFELIGAALVAQAHFYGLTGAVLKWKDHCCGDWAQIGLGFAHSADAADIRLSAAAFREASIGLTATRLPDGMIHFANPGFPEKRVPPFTCLPAFGGLASECNLGQVIPEA